MPNQGVPVIFKNKVAYGYAEKSVQAYDVSVSDYNALTEQQQLDGSIRFIQGVDAVPNGNNVWAKLGTTPLAEGLPRDCSQAVNELKSNLTDYIKAVSFTVPSSITRGADLTTYVNNNLDNGYKFLCWQVKCSSSGFVQDIYMTAPMNKTGEPYWSGTIGSGTIICVFFEIRDI